MSRHTLCACDMPARATQGTPAWLPADDSPWRFNSAVCHHMRGQDHNGLAVGTVHTVQRYMPYPLQVLFYVRGDHRVPHVRWHGQRVH